MLMRKYKAPGRDGIPVGFYKEHIEQIWKNLLWMYEQALQEGTLRLEVNKCIIKLVSKDGDKTLIKNWTPINV